MQAAMHAEARLMKAAQRFGLAFAEDRAWGDGEKHLAYTLQSWRELALAALAFAKSTEEPK